MRYHCSDATRPAPLKSGNARQTTPAERRLVSRSRTALACIGVNRTKGVVTRAVKGSDSRTIVDVDGRVARASGSERMGKVDASASDGRGAAQIESPPSVVRRSGCVRWEPTRRTRIRLMARTSCVVGPSHHDARGAVDELGEAGVHRIPHRHVDDHSQSSYGRSAVASPSSGSEAARESGAGSAMSGIGRARPTKALEMGR